MADKKKYNITLDSNILDKLINSSVQVESNNVLNLKTNNESVSIELPKSNLDSNLLESKEPTDLNKLESATLSGWSEYKDKDSPKSNSPKVVESKVVDSKATDSKVADSKVADSKLVDSKVSNSKVAESKVADSKSVDSKVSNSKVAESKLVESKVNDSKKESSYKDNGVQKEQEESKYKSESKESEYKEVDKSKYDDLLKNNDKEVSWEPKNCKDNSNGSDKCKNKSDDCDKPWWNYITILIFVFIITILYLILSYPTIDMWFMSYVPDSDYRWLLKGLLFFIILAIILVLLTACWY